MSDLIKLFDASWFGVPPEPEDTQLDASNTLLFEFPEEYIDENTDDAAIKYSESDLPLKSGSAEQEGAFASKERSESDPSSSKDISTSNKSITKADSSRSSSWLGTWACRQKIYRLIAGQEGLQNNASSQSNSDPVDASPGKTNDHNDKNRGNYVDSSLLDDAMLQEQAWKWRFVRKWQMEQMAGPVASREDDDEWLQALKMIENGGRPIPLQNGSLDRLDSFALMFSNSQSLNLLAGDSNATLDQDLGASTDEKMLASRNIRRAASKVEALLAYQQEIEREVSIRWKAANETWVGHYLPAVIIDSWGTFSFILGKVADSQNRFQKLLLRGGNQQDERLAVHMTREEISAEVQRRGLAWARLDVLGVGEIKWLSKKESKIAIRGIHVFTGLDEKFTDKNSVVEAAAAILQSQGMGYQTIMELEK